MIGQVLIENWPIVALPITFLVGLLTGRAMRDEQLFSNPARLHEAQRAWNNAHRPPVVIADESSAVGAGEPHDPDQFGRVLQLVPASPARPGYPYGRSVR